MPDPTRVLSFEISQITPMKTEAFLNKNGGCLSWYEKIGGFEKYDYRH